MEPVIRNVLSNDAAMLLSIRNLDEKSVKARLELQNQEKAEWLLLVKDGVVVGWVQLFDGRQEQAERGAKIEDLWIVESERGQGLGTLLLAECEHRVRKQGFTKIGLAVNPKDNPRARALYERLGYRHDGGAPYLDGVYGEYEDWVINLYKSILE